MSKADRAKKRRKNQQTFAEAVALGPIEPRKKSGQGAKAYRAPVDPEPPRVTLEARARQMGKPASQWVDMRSQALGEDAGRAIYYVAAPDDAPQLWGVYKGLTEAEVRYCRLKLGKSVSAKTAKIEMEPEKIETRAEESPPDDRTWEEKLRSATNRWMDWQRWMGMLSSADQTAIWDIARGRREAMTGGEITGAGVRFVAAIVNLAERVD